MITVRRADDRFHTQIAWLDSRHTFSFGEHQDEEQMGFRALRVINEDRVRGGAGFPTHPHRDMEIVSYVLEGALQHRDSMGTGSTIKPGDVQRMSAGTGVYHSEFNPQPKVAAHFLQIWILPSQRGLPPSYEQKTFAPEEQRGRLRLIGAPDGRDGAVTIHQDLALYAARLEPGETLTHAVTAGRHAWVQVARGGVSVNGEPLTAGDGAALSDVSEVTLTDAQTGTELLLFDLA